MLLYFQIKFWFWWFWFWSVSIPDLKFCYGPTKIWTDVSLDKTCNINQILYPFFIDCMGWKEAQKKLLTSLGWFMEECRIRMLHYQIIFHGGTVREGLCELLTEHKPHIVILGSRGSNKLHRKLQTSVSEYVIRNSDTPVLVVPLKKWKWNSSSEWYFVWSLECIGKRTFRDVSKVWWTQDQLVL